MSARTSPLSDERRAAADRARGRVDEGQRDRQPGLLGDPVEAALPVLRPAAGALGGDAEQEGLLGARPAPSSVRIVAPGLARSSGTPPVARSSGPSGPRKNSFLTSRRICTSLVQASSIVSTQSQLDVCGAPTRMPLRGTSPTARQRAARSSEPRERAAQQEVPPHDVAAGAPRTAATRRRDLAQRPAAVRDRVLLLRGQLGGGRPAPRLGRVLVGDEQHVVAEAAAPPHLADHAPGHPAVHDLLAAGVARARRRRRSAPYAARPGTSASWASSSSLLRSSSFGRARPARREHARHPVERVDAQAAVVGQRRQPGGREAGARLEQRVALERRLVLDRLVVRRDVVDAEHLDVGQRARARIRCHLLELLAVARGEEDPAHGGRTAPPTAGG